MRLYFRIIFGCFICCGQIHRLTWWFDSTLKCTGGFNLLIHRRGLNWSWNGGTLRDGHIRLMLCFFFYNFVKCDRVSRRNGRVYVTDCSWCALLIV